MSDSPPQPIDYEPDVPGTQTKTPVLRTLLAGTLMGAANLVPGVSGGTMVLACGVYQPFVDATADATRLRFTRQSVLFLVLLWGMKLVAMGALAAPVVWAVTKYPAVSYAAFAGMTLAGTPILWKMVRHPKIDACRDGSRGSGRASNRALLITLAVIGFLALAFLGRPMDKPDTGASADPYTPTPNIPLDAVAGLAALSAMVLPGISGGTIKLVLGRYEPTVWAIGQTWAWLVPWQSAAPLSQFGPIIVPYVLGAVAGLILVSNALKWLLHHYEQPMSALLLGILWGSAVAIWPRSALKFANPTLLAGCLVAAVIAFAFVYGLTRLKQPTAE